MRKTLLVITVLFVATQAYAGTVTMSVVDEGGGWASIGYSSDANVSAFGLKIYTDSDVNITEIKDYNIGECTATVQGYGIFPGTIDINEVTGLVDSNGTPIAPSSDPGAAGTGLDTNTIVVEMGALYVEPNHPAKSGTLLLVKVDGDCNVCVEGEPIRGNVVLTDANEAILDPTVACATIILGGGCGDCPLDITGWQFIPDGYVGPEDLGYLLTLINGCPYQYCLVGGLTPAEQCLDVTGWQFIPDGYVGPEDLGYLLTLINGCAYQYCLCPIQ